MDLNDATVVITGASAGVGRATARAFAAKGARLAVIARGGPGLDAVESEVRARGGRVLALPVDVSDFAAVDEAASRIESELGPIDVWVNDAMATIFARVWDIEPDEYRRALEVTFLGGVNGTLAALHRMRPRNRGTIIQVGSALAYRAIPLQSAYCSSKFALRAFTDSLRCELSADGSDVRVTMVHLPGLNTPQFSWVRVRGLPHTPRPVAPVYQPEIPADAIVWAATHRRREWWVGGSTVATVIGNRLAPRAADFYLSRTNVKAQQTDDPVAPDRRDYLFHSVPEDRGAHGAFDATATSRSWQWQASKRLPILLGLTGAGALAGAARALR